MLNGAGDKENSGGSIDGEGLAKMFAKTKGKRRKSSGLRSNGESKRSALPLADDPDRPCSMSPTTESLCKGFSEKLNVDSTSVALALDASSAPADIAGLAVFADEYQRSVAHLYPEMETASLGKGRVEQALD